MNKIKRVSSIVGIVLIILMYLTALFAAIFSPANAPGLFLAAIFCTVAIPIMIYGFIEVYKYVHRNDPPKKQEGNNNKGK